MACIKAKSVEEQKKLLTVSIRNEVVHDLVTQMYAFRPKPDRAYCTTVAKELVKKYPFMKDSGTSVTGYVSFSQHYYVKPACFIFFSTFQGSWEKKLIERVHNVQSSSGRKRSPLSEELPVSRSKRGHPKATSHARYPHIDVLENDEASNQRNVKELNKELQRGNPRKEIVISLLQQTFSARREDVLKEEDGITFADILEAHPVLALPYAVSEEHNL